jgi:MFS family permease
MDRGIEEAILPPEVPTRRRGLWLVAFVLLGPCSLSMAFGVIAPLLGPLAHRFGGDAVAQKIVVGPQLGLAIGGLFAGWIMARLGTRLAIVVSTVLFSLAGAAGLYAQSASILLFNTYLLGGAAVVLATASSVVLADHYAGDERGRMVGYQTALASLAQAGGVVLSGLIAQWSGWRAPFLLFIVIGVATLLVGVAAVGRERPVPSEKSALDLRLFVPVLPIYLAIAVTLLVATTTFTHMSLLLAAQGISSPAIAALLIAIQGAAAMASAFSYGFLVARAGRPATVGLGVVLGAAGMMFSGLTPGLPAFAAGSIGMGVTVGLSFPFLIEETMRLAPGAIRPQALGFLQTSQFVGGFANPFVVGPVTAAIGLRGMYVAVGVTWLCVAIAGLAVLAAARRRSP